MANATDIVKKGVVRWTDEFITRSSATLASETRFYPNAMVGLTTGGYFAKYDDSASMVFVGVVRNDQGAPLLPAGTAGDGTIDLPIHQPKRFELAITSIAVTDIGKKVYASDDQTGVLATSSTTYGNLIGTVVDVVATSIALVEPVYDGTGANGRLGAARQLAATGAQTLTKWDLNKTVFVPNTATLTITTPAVADTQAGDRLTIVKSHASDTNAITLDPPSSETIDGATTLATLDAPYDTVILVSTGAAWIVVARDIA